MPEIDHINRFLDECGTFTMITSLNGRGTGRPFAYHEIRNGRLNFMVGRFKDAYKQMELCNHVEIVACKGDNWLRYEGDAVFFQDDDMFEDMMRRMPFLENLYTGPEDVVFFYLENANVEYHVQWDLKQSVRIQ